VSNLELVTKHLEQFNVSGEDERLARVRKPNLCKKRSQRLSQNHQTKRKGRVMQMEMTAEADKRKRKARK
jgi:hypothetical protein